jgi:hypothetical protein
MDIEAVFGFVLLLLAKIGKAVSPGSSTTAGAIPVADGSGGYTWGAATSGVMSATDTNNDGNVEILFVEGS